MVYLALKKTNMKKVLLITLLFAGIFIVSCSSPTDQLKKDTENYIKASLKDPASYQFISIRTDTLMMRSNLQSDLTSDSTLVATYKLDSLSIDKVKGQEKVVALDREMLSNLKTDSIYKLLVEIKYRAKNGFGALDVYEHNLEYDRNKKTLQKSALDKD